MPDIEEQVGIKDKIHIVLRGPDGEIKDERGGEDEADEEHGISQQARD